MRLVSFGTLTLPLYLGEDSPPVNFRSATIGMQGGSYDQDGQRVHLTSVRVSRRMVIIAEGGQTIDEQIDAINQEGGKGTRILKAVLRDGTTYRQTWAKMISLDRDNRPGNLGQQPVSVEFFIPRPLWLVTADEPSYLDNGLYLDDGWNLDTGNYTSRAMAASPDSFTITNSGGYRISRGYVVIIPRAASSIVNPEVHNVTTGEWLRYNGTLNAGDRLDVDFLTKSVKVNGSDAYDGFEIGYEQLDWMTLELGANSISVTGTVTGTVDVRWQWSKHYL